MNVFWLGKTQPPPGIDFQIAGGINKVVGNSLVFVDDLRFLNGNSQNTSRVYLVTDKPASQIPSSKVDGVIPRDIRVISAIKDLFSEICQSTQTSDDLLATLDEKELVIREKQDILLRDSKRYKAMIKHASDLIFILGTKGRIMFCNETFKQYIEMGKGSLIGKSFINFVFDEDRQNLECFIQESFREGVPLKIEVRLNFPGGNIGTFSLMSTPLKEGEHIYAVSIIARDISDIRSMQHRLMMQAKNLSSMIDGLSHELRNPLTIAGAYVRRLIKDEDAKNRSKRLQAVSGINSSLGRIEEMITRIEGYESVVNMCLYYSKMNLFQLVKDVCAEDSKRNSITLKKSRPIRIFSDSDHIRIALRRILENAWESGSSTIDIQLWQNENFAWIGIRDYGCGMHEDSEAIFAPFYSTDPLKIGLGLTETRIAMIKIGGEIHIESPTGPGTIVNLRIPVVYKADSALGDPAFF